MQWLRTDLHLQSTAIMALQEVGETFFGGPTGAGKPVHATCNARHYNAERHTIG